jgi:hypothetical protein
LDKRNDTVTIRQQGYADVLSDLRRAGDAAPATRYCVVLVLAARFRNQFPVVSGRIR